MEDIIKYFPMQEFRPKQKEVLIKVWEYLCRDKNLILLQAPVGFGKSAVNTALCRWFAPSIYTTPQLNLIDQITGDKYLGKYFVEIKGRDNYRCAKDRYITPVKYGLCKREKGIIPEKCKWTVECPYYSQKFKAIESPIALMSTAYFIVDAYQEQPNFSGRKLIVIDEGHFLAEYVAGQVSLEVSSHTLPYEIWRRYKNNPTNIEPIINDVEAYLTGMQTRLVDGGTLSDEEVREKVKAEEFLLRAKRFVATEMVASWVWTQKNSGMVARPVYSRWLMDEMVWQRGEKFIISSATIINPKIWIHENGADLKYSPNEMVFIDVGSTFPPENRPVVDMSVGSMRYDQQNENIDRVVSILQYIISVHKGENIAVHFPSYRLARLVAEKIGVKVYLPSPEDRDMVLNSWKNNGGVFFAVAYYEGQDWKYDTCTVQVLVKTLYPDVSDPVVRKRLEKKDYQWLMWTALVKCLQAYGRAVRAEDDRMVFYVLDEQFWSLIGRNYSKLPDWFKEVVPDERRPKKYRKTGR
ncbi:MAG: helicase C-terminal domain-containing protein [Candidatus Caldarchaeum sp.]